MCVCTCFAKRVILICYDLLSLQTQPLTMKWSENRRSRLTSNQPMPLNKRAGSGLGICAESSCYWNLKTNVDSIFGSSSGKMQSFIAIQPSLFRSWEMTMWTSSVRFVQILLLSMPLRWWKHGDPNMFPYLSRIYPVLNPYFHVLSNFEKKETAFQNPVIYP